MHVTELVFIHALMCFACSCMDICSQAHVNLCKSTNKTYIYVQVHLSCVGQMPKHRAGQAYASLYMVGYGMRKSLVGAYIHMWHACTWAFMYDVWQKGMT